MATTIEKAKIIPERLWAWDISEEDFPVMFKNRFPKSDVLPTRTKYLLYRLPKQRGIDAFNEENIVPDEVLKKEAEIENQNWDCKGCGREFESNHIGRRSHVSKCKGMLDMRT